MWATDKARISILRSAVGNGAYKDYDNNKLHELIKEASYELYNGVHENELGDFHTTQYFIDRLRGSIYKLSLWCDFMEENNKKRLKGEK